MAEDTPAETSTTAATATPEATAATAAIPDGHQKEFDGDGKIKKESWHKNGQKIREKEYSQGNLKKDTVWDEYGRAEVWEYNENGKLIKKGICNKDKILSTTEYEYDANGKLKGEHTHDNTTGSTRERVYENGMLVKRTSIKKSLPHLNKDTETEEYVYNKETGTATRTSWNETTHKKIEEYTSNNYTGISKKTLYDEDGNKTKEVNRDEKNRILNGIYYYPNGNKSREYIDNIKTGDYKDTYYYENGNKSREFIFDAETGIGEEKFYNETGQEITKEEYNQQPLEKILFYRNRTAPNKNNKKQGPSLASSSSQKSTATSTATATTTATATPKSTPEPTPAKTPTPSPTPTATTTPTPTATTTTTPTETPTPTPTPAPTSETTPGPTEMSTATTTETSKTAPTSETTPEPTPTATPTATATTTPTATATPKPMATTTPTATATTTPTPQPAPSYPTPGMGGPQPMWGQSPWYGPQLGMGGPWMPYPFPWYGPQPMWGQSPWYGAQPGMGQQPYGASQQPAAGNEADNSQLQTLQIFAQFINAFMQIAQSFVRFGLGNQKDSSLASIPITPLMGGTSGQGLQNDSMSKLAQTLGSLNGGNIG